MSRSSAGSDRQNVSPVDARRRAECQDVASGLHVERKALDVADGHGPAVHGERSTLALKPLVVGKRILVPVSYWMMRFPVIHSLTLISKSSSAVLS